MAIPVIDLFAGPGGLGEGFSGSKKAEFRIAVSIEKDGSAHETLRLRAAHRALTRSGKASAAVWRTWDRILSEAPWNVAFEHLMDRGGEAIRAACLEARAEALNVELGPSARGAVSKEIRKRLAPYMDGDHLPENIVLIGGPPCQAYSIVGRSRNKGKKDYKAEDDHRHFLYREYLAVINEFRPAVFIMENVKGILTSRVGGGAIFQTISRDLRRPDLACDQDSSLEYVLVALPKGASADDAIPDPRDFLVTAERHGVPQARHRVIICGVRRDVFEEVKTVPKLRSESPPTVRDVIASLPERRSLLSHRGKGLEWRASLEQPLMKRALQQLDAFDTARARAIAATMRKVQSLFGSRKDPGAGSDRQIVTPQLVGPKKPKGWYVDRPLTLLANHESRSHMPDDLVRYLFVSAFGQDTDGESPRLDEFPKALLPKHKNVDPKKPQDAIFKDRFRVQVWDRVAMTVTSHISKDGHAFIHPDPRQCRSLTVREAARLQTFPDSYVFLGNRTSQYTQVGNAVPPYLARQIANVVADVLLRAKLA
jgi:DNA (cytosine-5)-methyltransferase 1